MRNTIVALEEGDLRPGLSHRSAQAVLSDCVGVLGSFYFLTRPTPQRHALANTCAALASTAAAAMPAFSYAWYVLAATADIVGDVPQVNAGLLASQGTGANEQWIAELRVDVADDRFAELSPAVLAGHEQDLRLLVTSHRGVEKIARRYVDEPGFRERITRIVETLPPEAQRLFLSYLQQAAGTT
ncbi:MAG: hypothetical protein ABL879_14840 [Devosia sp.]